MTDFRAMCEDLVEALDQCQRPYGDQPESALVWKARAARRPKPPTLKEQALEVVTGLEKRWDLQCDLALIRRALEALPND
jgi:hypothetical protein